MVGSHIGIHGIEILSHLAEVCGEECEARDINEILADSEADGNSTDTRSASAQLVNDHETLGCHSADNVIHLREGSTLNA